jgi:hypothetical protein
MPRFAQGWLLEHTPQGSSPGRVHRSLRVAQGSSLLRDVRPFAARPTSDRTATMASADFCSIPASVTPRRAETMTLGTGGFSTSFEMGRSPEPIAIPLPVEQISPDKSVSFPCTTAPFTMSSEPGGFAIGGWLAPRTWPRMAFLFVGSQVCRGLPPDPSSRRRPYLWLVVAVDTIDVGSPTGDLHPVSSRPCRAYHPSFQRTAGFAVCALKLLALGDTSFVESSIWNRVRIVTSRKRRAARARTGARSLDVLRNFPLRRYGTTKETSREQDGYSEASRIRAFAWNPLLNAKRAPRACLGSPSNNLLHSNSSLAPISISALPWLVQKAS